MPDAVYHLDVGLAGVVPDPKVPDDPEPRPNAGNAGEVGGGALAAYHDEQSEHTAESHSLREVETRRRRYRRLASPSFDQLTQEAEQTAEYVG